MTKVIVRLKGGPGSGHHGHAGRPGKHGGSLPGKGGGGKNYQEEAGKLRSDILGKILPMEHELRKRVGEDEWKDFREGMDDLYMISQGEYSPWMDVDDEDYKGYVDAATFYPKKWGIMKGEGRNAPKMDWKTSSDNRRFSVDVTHPSGRKAFGEVTRRIDPIGTGRPDKWGAQAGKTQKSNMNVIKGPKKGNYFSDKASAVKAVEDYMYDFWKHSSALT